MNFGMEWPATFIGDVMNWSQAFRTAVAIIIILLVLVLYTKELIEFGVSIGRDARPNPTAIKTSQPTGDIEVSHLETFVDSRYTG